ncbi:serine palmitoyltransferase 2 [Cristinia sonorae]|uniref:serine C-palmitoyltransferase n=1 Tax=Cristinia sonorae TaxID=1940300 RepID=A0A8K0UG69_9AGAR|nr:serine palmitoyltransferase 2 [Cristinia sonorae]
MSTAASYLSAVSQADARARKLSDTDSTTSTPALSLSSSVTSSSTETVLDDAPFENLDGLSYPKVPPTSEQVFKTVHSEFGHCANESFRYTARYQPGGQFARPEQEPPHYVLLSTYLSYLLLICVGHLRDFIGKRMRPSSYKHLMKQDGYMALNSDFDSFYTRRLMLRIDDCFFQPVTGVPGRTIVLLDRSSPDYNITYYPTGTRTRALNISSYNYLGFAQATGGCADAVEESVRRYGVAACGTRLEGGSLDLHLQAEALVARFIGTEDALISSMGFATNSTIIPALVSKGSLVISDELNHASIRFGVRLSGANVRMFKHNNMESLEQLLREVISQGQPKTHRPWKKILVIVEGLYSMEGNLCNLPAVLELKKKYKFYLFVDEAHSIGALGPHGRGVCDYFGINPRSVDILMGTFTKSFGAAGGYIAGNKNIIDRLRTSGHTGAYAEAMTPPVLTQVIASTASIMGISIQDKNSSLQSQAVAYPGPVPSSALPPWMPLAPTMIDGTDGAMRLRRLAFNARYLNRALRLLGFLTYGNDDSPVVPLLLFNPGKMAVFARLMRTRATPIVVVIVAYPATPLVTSRVRFCLSASHTKEDIDTVLTACDEIGDLLDLKQGTCGRWPLEEIMARAVEIVQMKEMP